MSHLPVFGHRLSSEALVSSLQQRDIVTNDQPATTLDPNSPSTTSPAPNGTATATTTSLLAPYYRPDVSQWRQKLFDLAETIHMTANEYATYFPLIDGVYFKRSTRVGVKYSVTTYYCRLNGSNHADDDDGQESSDLPTPNFKRRKIVRNPDTQCPVRLRVIEFHAQSPENPDPIAIPEAAGERGSTHAESRFELSRMHPDTVSGHTHDLDKSDRYKINSLIRAVALRELMKGIKASIVYHAMRGGKPPGNEEGIRILEEMGGRHFSQQFVNNSKLKIVGYPRATIRRRNRVSLGSQAGNSTLSNTGVMHNNFDNENTSNEDPGGIDGFVGDMQQWSMMSHLNQLQHQQTPQQRIAADSLSSGLQLHQPPGGLPSDANPFQSPPPQPPSQHPIASAQQHPPSQSAPPQSQPPPPQPRFHPHVPEAPISHLPSAPPPRPPEPTTHPTYEEMKLDVMNNISFLFETPADRLSLVFGVSTIAAVANPLLPQQNREGDGQAEGVNEVVKPKVLLAVKVSVKDGSKEALMRGMLEETKKRVEGRLTALLVS